MPRGKSRRTHITYLEEQTLQLLELGGGDGQEPGGGIELGTGCCLVTLEGIGGEQQEGGALRLIHSSEMYGVEGWGIPVSTIPAVDDKMGVLLEPYVMVWSIPQ